MEPSEFSMLENRIMDWYESLNNRNTLDTPNMRTRMPPFLNYTDNNGYSFKADNGNIVTFSSDQQSVIRELINEEIDRLNSFRNNAQNSMTSEGGGRNRNKNTSKKNKKTKRAKRAKRAKNSKKNKKTKRAKKY